MSIENRKAPPWSLIVFKKEFMEIFRDRRTLMSVVISPLLITPASFALLGLLISGRTEQVRTQTYKVGVLHAEAGRELMQALEKTPNLQLIPILSGPDTKTEAEQNIKDRKMNAVIVLPPDADSLLKQERAVPIEILVDAGSDNSQAVYGRLADSFSRMGQERLRERLAARSLPTDFATPFLVSRKAIAQGGTQGTLFLAMMLPYILAVSAFGGAIYAAFDQVAGEKERGTLETLLVSPASRRDIVLGKFGAVVAVCLISSLLSIVGMIFAFTSRAKAFEWIAKGGMTLSPTGIGVTLLVMIPLSVLFAGLLLAVSTFARNQKEAQTYLGPLFMLVLMPAMASMILGSDVARAVALVPVLNTTIIIKQALASSYDPVFILLAFLASALYAGVALAYATRLFQKESVLIKA